MSIILPSLKEQDVAVRFIAVKPYVLFPFC